MTDDAQLPDPDQPVAPIPDVQGDSPPPPRQTETLPPRRYGYRLSGRRLADWYAEFNPFYLLSATSMLLGLLLLANTTSWSPKSLSTLLPLLATLQVYEAACLGIVALLYRKLGGRRDTTELAALLALFAVDVSFLMSEIATESVAVGSAIAGVLFLLALVKLVIGGLALRVTFARVPLLFGVIGLALLHVVPPTLAWIDGDNGGVTVDTLYTLWWIVGAAPLLWSGLAWWRGEEHRSTQQVLLAALPWASLAVHVGVLHYVYDRPFLLPHATPILLGLAVLATIGRRQDTAFWRFTLPITGWVVALGQPDAFAGWLQPREVGIGAAYLAWAFCNVPRYLPHFAAVGACVAVAGWFGPSWQQVRDLWRQAYETLRSFTPRTQTHWGIVSVALAFLLLACGVVTSLLARRHQHST